VGLFVARLSFLSFCLPAAGESLWLLVRAFTLSSGADVWKALHEPHSFVERICCDCLMRKRIRKMTAREKNSRRDPEKERFWGQKIAQQEKSGLNKKDFCDREGINLNTFLGWERIIPQRDAERQASRPREVSFWLYDEQYDREFASLVSDEPSMKNSFMPFVMNDTKKKRCHQELVAEVRFGNSKLCVFRGADFETLRSLLILFKEFCD
jgi:hypothetical protein